ncbi:MAG: hypothetical protein ACLSD6_02085 [Clostridium sp.]
MMASSVAENPTDTVASGSAVTINQSAEVRYPAKQVFLTHGRYRETERRNFC